MRVHRVHVCLTFCVWILIVGSASAQERIELLARGASTSYSVLIDVEVGPAGLGAIRHVTRVDHPIWLGTPNPALSNRQEPNAITALAGGRFLVWPAFLAGRLGPVGFDRLTRQVLDFTSLLPGRTHFFHADPLRPRLFAGGEDAESRAVIWLVDIPTMSVRRVFSGGIPGGLDFAYAADPDRLFVISDGFINVIDVATASLLHRFPAKTLPPVIVNRAGTRLFQSSYSEGVYRLDPTDGHVLASSGSMVSSTPHLDEARGILLTPWSAEGRVAVLDQDTLGNVGVVQVSPVPASTPGIIERFDVETSIGPTGAYVVRTEHLQNQQIPCANLALDSIDGTGRLSRTLDLLDLTGLRGVTGCEARAVVLRPPDAPRMPSALVEGRRVTLSWQTPGVVQGYLIEAGASSGETLHSFRTGPDESVSFDGVPPGTYFVRILALNDIGAGAPSSEVIVNVP